MNPPEMIQQLKTMMSSLEKLPRSEKEKRGIICQRYKGGSAYESGMIHIDIGPVTLMFEYRVYDQTWNFKPWPLVE